jgi:elongation factor 3
MEDACLAVLVPLMVRALRERSTITKRRASIIIENMSKLVQNPADARPFLPLLLPGLEEVAQASADPELREVAGRARDALRRIKAADEELQAASTAHAVDAEALVRTLERAVGHAKGHGNGHANGHANGASAAHPPPAVLAYVACLASGLIRSRLSDAVSWEACVMPYLAPFLSGGEEAATEVAATLRRFAMGSGVRMGS